VVVKAYWYGNNYADATQLTPTGNLALAHQEEMSVVQNAGGERDVIEESGALESF